MLLQKSQSRKKRSPIVELADEVAILRRTFKKAVSLATESRSKRSTTQHKLKKIDQDLAQILSQQLKDMDEGIIRKIRSGIYYY